MTSYDKCIQCGVPFGKTRGWAGRHCDGCRNWNHEAFPITSDIASLRSTWRNLREAQREIERAGKWLSAFKARWPEGANAGLAEWKEMKSKLEAMLRKLSE